MLLLATISLLAIAALGHLLLPVSPAEKASAEVAGDTDLMSFVASLPDEGFERPSPTWKLDLPGDHGVHSGSRTETWHLSAHLRDQQGKILGFQLSYLRLSLAPPSAPPPKSVWEARDVYRGHVTFLHADLDRPYGEERFARGMPGLAGFDAETGELRLDNWFLRFGAGRAEPKIDVYATVRDKAVVNLVMRAEKTAVSSEPTGADAPFVGYSLTRLSVEGTVDRGGGEQTVSGTAWLNHTWGDLPLPGGGPVARDSLQFHLEDGTDVFAIRSRRTDGKGSATLNGIVVERDATMTAFDDENIQMTSTRWWRDEATPSEYPVAWRLEGADLDLTVEPLIDSQAYDFSTPIWSGIVKLSGTRGDALVSGTGTLQLTGYEQR